MLEVAQNHRADGIALQIHGQAVGDRIAFPGCRELDHFTLHYIVKAVDPSDTVSQTNNSAFGACFGNRLITVQALPNQITDFGGFESVSYTHLDVYKRQAIELARLFEPALGTLVSPSRLVHYSGELNHYNPTEPNPYCQPVSTFYSRQILEGVHTRDQLLFLQNRDKSRYVTFNICPLERIYTVESRMHNGCLLYTSRCV